MKTLTVKITFQIPEYYADGAFEKTTAEDIHEALCRAYPLCDMGWIKVEDVLTPAVPAPWPIEAFKFASGDRVRSKFSGREGTVEAVHVNYGSVNVEVVFDDEPSIPYPMGVHEIEHVKKLPQGTAMLREFAKKTWEDK